jgi:hypothetical protein
MASVKKAIQLGGYRSDANTEFAHEFRNDRQCDYVAGRKSWTMSSMCRQGRNNLPPRFEIIDRDRNQVTNLALSVAHGSLIAG